MFTKGVLTRLGFAFAVFFSAILIAGSPAFGQAEFREPVNDERNPGRGLRVLQVDAGGTAARLRLQPMDMLTRYGKFEIIDHSSYFKAREAYDKLVPSVEIEVWRGDTRLKTKVPTGPLGIDTMEDNPVAFQFRLIMQSIEVGRQIPEYQRGVEFTDVEDENKALEKGRAFIDAAERDGTLTRSQILVARIELILDNAPEAELNKQKELIATFISTEPVAFCYYLGTELWKRKHFRAAIPLLKRYLGSYPDDLETRLNVGYAAFHIGSWDEAEAAADHILRNPERLAEQGFVVAYQNKMMAALARKDFSNSIVFAEKCFEIKQTGFFLSVMLLAAAQKGDIEKFKEASHKFQETLPADYEKYKFRIDAAEALALVKNNQEDLGREIVQRGKTIDRVEGRLKYFWSYYPHGMDIVDNWQRLAKN